MGECVPENQRIVVLKKKTEKNAVIQIPVLRNAYHKLWNWADFDLNPSCAT